MKSGVTLQLKLKLFHIEQACPQGCGPVRQRITASDKEKTTTVVNPLTPTQHNFLSSRECWGVRGKLRSLHIHWGVAQPLLATSTTDAQEVTKYLHHSPLHLPHSFFLLFLSAPSSCMCIWLRTRHKPARLIEQTWELDTFREKQAGLLADKWHSHHPTASQDSGIPPISVEEVMNVCVRGGGGEK